MSATFQKKRRARQKRIFQEGRRRIRLRLENVCEAERPEPMMTAANIHYEHANRVKGLSAGGIGAIFLLAQKIGLIDDINRDLHLLKRHLPYHESDHVLNIAFNIVAGGRHLEHLELRRNDEVYLDALGAKRIPDPTTEGDFCRRFMPADVEALMDIINGARLRVWAQQPDEFLGRKRHEGKDTHFGRKRHALRNRPPVAIWAHPNVMVIFCDKQVPRPRRIDWHDVQCTNNTQEISHGHRSSQIG